MQKTLNSIKFPVYPIPNAGIVEVDGYKLVYRTKHGTEYIIDDISLQGKFLQRRLALLEGENKVLPLKKAILNLGNLVLFARLYKYFIDSTGRLFKYKTSRSVPVITKKVIRHYPYKNSTVLVLERCHCPIILPRPLRDDEQYAIVALAENGYLLLGMSRTEYLRKHIIKI